VVEVKKVADTVRISYKPGETIKIKPISDIHFGSRHCDVKALKRFLGEPDEKTYLIGLGDWLDCVITSDIKRYRKSGDGSEGEEIIDEQVDNLVDIMTPFKSQIIGIATGNHEDTITKHCGTNPSRRMADRLGVTYLGFSFLLRLLLTQGGQGGRTVILRGHHGWGGGSRTQGADITKCAKDMAYFDADIFLYGHTHKLQCDTVPRLSLNGDRLIARPKHLCICGTFLKTYSDSTDVTYSEAKGYPPVSLGGLEISIKPDSHAWCDIDVSTWRA
jgi:UDP-2,3-diacylglucosamine pyrophosphatase LpxH